MKKRVIYRMLIGFPFGISIAQLLSLLFSVLVDDSTYHPITPELASMLNNEILAAALQLLLSGLLGGICFASSLIWERDEWSLTKQVVLNFMIVCSSTVFVASVLQWLRLTWAGLLLFLGVFIVVYFLIWIVSYQFYRIQVNKINRKLSRR